MKIDKNTEQIIELIMTSDLHNRPDLLELAKIAFLDYIASALTAKNSLKVIELATLLQTRSSSKEEENTFLLGQQKTSTIEMAAFFNGFCSHYLDYDDAQANIAGHFSTVLFSTLLAIAKPQDTVLDVLTAYLVGAELEGLIGALINPAHKQLGWHSTGTVGPIGAAAAIAKLRKLSPERTTLLISMACTQSSGMGFEAGSDVKPLHSGFAARNAVFAYWLLENTELTAQVNVFNNKTGWLNTFANITVEPSYFKDHWFAPGQVIKPGLWMKIYPYCSAAICGTSACEKLLQKELIPQGYSWSDIKQVIFHFPPGADKALRYPKPETGQEGRFSMEYVSWQILAADGLSSEYFLLDKVPEEFTRAVEEGKFLREYDLPAVEKSVRVIKVTIILKNGEKVEFLEDNPLGSPTNPFSPQDLLVKLENATSKEFTEQLLNAVKNWPEGTWQDILPLLK